MGIFDVFKKKSNKALKKRAISKGLDFIEQFEKIEKNKFNCNDFGFQFVRETGIEKYSFHKGEHIMGRLYIYKNMIFSNIDNNIYISDLKKLELINYLNGLEIKEDFMCENLESAVDPAILLIYKDDFREKFFTRSCTREWEDEIVELYLKNKEKLEEKIRERSFELEKKIQNSFYSS